MALPNHNVTFNDNDLASITGVELYNYNATDLPERDIRTYKLARRSLSITTSAEYVSKDIRLFMKVCSGKRADTERTLTQLKAILQVQNGNLVVWQNGGQFRYTATMNEFNINWNVSTALVEVVMIASTPVATSIDEDVIANFNVTSSNTGRTIEVDGSFIAMPLINVVINSVTGGNGSLSVFNGLTNQGITLTRNFVAGDRIEIDSQNYNVRINGSNVDFTGMFPSFSPGQQRIAYSDTFGARNVDISAVYNVKII